MMTIAASENGVDNASKQKDAQAQDRPKEGFAGSAAAAPLPRVHEDLSGFIAGDRWMVGKYER